MKLQDFDFRIWDSNINKFVKVLIDDNIRVVPRNDDNIEIELWSGFYDKNGKKIYEGDIVKYDSRTKPLVAVFERSTFYIVDTSIEKHLQVDCGTRLQGIYENGNNGYTNNKLECLEVIGNIHENADLLEKERGLIMRIECKYEDIYDSKGFPKY